MGKYEEMKISYIDTMITKTAQAMRKQMLLPKNMRKGLWFTMTDYEIWQRLNEEMSELREAIFMYLLKDDSLPQRKQENIEFKRNKIITEAADVCNFLGFLIDNQGGEV